MVSFLPLVSLAGKPHFLCLDPLSMSLHAKAKTPVAIFGHWGH